MLEFGPKFKHHSTVVDKGPPDVKKLSCLNPECSLHRNVESRRIIRYGFYRTTAGKRRRYRCARCGQAFSTTKGTPYYRLQHRRTTFDTVVTLSVEGVSRSAIARVERLAWNTVARWLEKPSKPSRNDYGQRHEPSLKVSTSMGGVKTANFSLSDNGRLCIMRSEVDPINWTADRRR